MATGAWCWFSNPRVHYSARYNRLYTGWVASDGSIMAEQVDVATGAQKTVNLHPTLNVDDHANPSFIELPDGRIFVFYAHHQGSDILYRETATGDLTHIGSELSLGVANYCRGGGSFSYANPVHVPSQNRIMVFFRQNLSDRNRWCVAVNENGHASATWAGYPLWDSGPAGPYLQVVSDPARDVIDLLLTTDHPANGVCDLYHARYRHVNGAPQWQSGTGVPITAVPFGPAQATKILDGASVGNLWIEQIAYGADGVPVALVDTYPGNDPTAPHLYRYVRLDGSPVETICEAGGPLVTEDAPSRYYSGGGCFDGNDTSTVYLSRKLAEGWTIEKWRRVDGMWGYGHVETVSGPTAEKQFRPYSAKGYPAGAPRVRWFRGPYRNYYDCTSTLLPVTPTPREALLTACQQVESDTGASESVRTLAQTLRIYTETS